MDAKKFYSVLTEYFCDYIISWMEKKFCCSFLFPSYFFVGLHKNIFALLRKKNLPVAHEYQYHFYNEARPTDFLRRSIRVFEYALSMASGWKRTKHWYQI